MVLLTPGPCQTSLTVREAATIRDLNHRSPEFLEIYSSVKEGLLSLYEGTRAWECYLIGGSGTSAMEAMATSCVSHGPVLILENGYYSARLAEIFEVHGIACDRMAFGWFDPLSLTMVEDRLKAMRYEAVLVTHHETTTSRLNPAEAIGKLAHGHDARCLVDAMSSFGADPIGFEHLDAVCSSANKCLHGIAGVSFVLATAELASEMRTFPRRTFSLHLPFLQGDSPRNTPAVPAISALRQALIELAPIGVDGRRKEYLDRAGAIREALRRHDLVFVVEPSKASCSLTVSQVPGGFTAEGWLAANRERGYELYGCKGELADRYFQVANMGELPMSDIQGWTATLDALLA